jgi:hypothetical protein
MGGGVRKGTGVNIFELDVVVLVNDLAWQFVQYFARGPSSFLKITADSHIFVYVNIRMYS